MKNLIVPSKLQKGDTVAAVSLSWGGAGDESIRWRYERGKEYLKESFGLNVIEMTHTLDGSESLYKHPENRAKDFMDAFKDPSIKGIFTTIGGDDGIRLLEYVDFSVIKQNPKVFLGFSDTTVHHLMCYKAGLRSYYGPALLVEFAEHNKMQDYTKKSVEQTLFKTDNIGEIKASKTWTSDDIAWDQKNQGMDRQLYTNKGYMFLQGTGQTKGHLLGGCIDVLEMVKGTTIWPSLEEFDQAVLFFEPSHEHPTPEYLSFWLRNYGAMGVFDRINAIVFGKPHNEEYFEDYKQAILNVVGVEYRQPNLPIVYNANIGHTSPMFVIPYGAQMVIDCDQATISIQESGVKE